MLFLAAPEARDGMLSAGENLQASKLQAPEKRQISTSKWENSVELKLGAWSFSEAWILDAWNFRARRAPATSPQTGDAHVSL
jgi:hypothetical protein